MMLNTLEESSFSVVFAVPRLHSGCASVQALCLLLRCADVANSTSDLLAIHHMHLDDSASSE